MYSLVRTPTTTPSINDDSNKLTLSWTWSFKNSDFLAKMPYPSVFFSFPRRLFFHSSSLNSLTLGNRLSVGTLYLILGGESIMKFCSYYNRRDFYIIRVWRQFACITGSVLVWYWSQHTARTWVLTCVVFYRACHIPIWQWWIFIVVCLVIHWWHVMCDIWMKTKLCMARSPILSSLLNHQKDNFST